MIKVQVEESNHWTGMGQTFPEHLQGGAVANFSEFTYAGITVHVSQVETDATDTTITIRRAGPVPNDGEDSGCDDDSSDDPNEGETFSTEPSALDTRSECLDTLYRMITKRLPVVDNNAESANTRTAYLIVVERLAAVIAILQKA